MPDVKGREQILRVHTRKIPLATNVNLERIAKGTPGLSGAELSNVVNESALLAARRNKPAVDNLPTSRTRKTRSCSGWSAGAWCCRDEERKLTAYHEAGHALVEPEGPRAGTRSIGDGGAPRGRRAGRRRCRCLEGAAAAFRQVLGGARLAMACGCECFGRRS